MNSAHDSSVTSSGRHYLVAIIALSVLARLAAGLLLGNQVESLPGTADQVSYHVLATRVIEGHGFTFGEPWWPATQPDSPTAHWSFLYTYYLVAVYSVLGVWPLAARLIQVIAVAVLMPVLAYSLGRQVFDQRTGLIAAALTAGYAYFVYYAAALMTESFYMCAILAALYLAARIVGFWRADKNPEPGVLLRLSAGLGRPALEGQGAGISASPGAARGPTPAGARYAAASGRPARGAAPAGDGPGGSAGAAAGAAGP